MGGFDWSSSNQAACPDFYTSHVGWVISFEIFRCRMPELMDLAASFNLLIDCLCACVHWIGEVISGVRPYPFRLTWSWGIQRRVNELHFILIERSRVSTFVDCEELRLSNLENGKHLSDFDVPVWVKPSAGADVAYFHGLTSLK